MKGHLFEREISFVFLHEEFTAKSLIGSILSGAGALVMAAGLMLTTLARSVVALVVTVGLLFFTGIGAVCFGIIMSEISPMLTLPQTGEIMKETGSKG